jgi:putative hydroxymethylpyrimidine transport system permease protein
MPATLPASLSSILRAFVTAAVLVALWHLGVAAFHPEPFILPGPIQVFDALRNNFDYLLGHALVTLSEIALGLLVGTALGLSTALIVASWRFARHWILPLLVMSQALPVFAIAPLLVVWFGYGLGSKIVMTTIIIFFPITSAFQDGLRRTDPGLLDLARLARASRLQTLRLLKIPSALPALASGLRVAVAAAPIGAIVGEWVGASAGLGYVMLHANARSQVDVMFAALLILGVMAAVLWFTVDALLTRLVPWSEEKRLA